MAGERFYGIVKFFNDAKGFGFIRRDDGRPDVFVHVKEVQVCGVQTLAENQKLSFEIEEGDRGPRATRLELIGGASA